MGNIKEAVNRAIAFASRLRLSFFYRHKKRKLLLNFVYYHPVGHAAEALKFARGFYEANRNLEIYLMLNDRTPYEIAHACPWIRKVYPINTNEVYKKGNDAECLKNVPSEWDYVMTNNIPLLEAKKIKRISLLENELIKTLECSEKKFSARIGKGCLYPELMLPKDLRYKHDNRVSFRLPKEAVDFAKKYAHKGKKIAIMLGGWSGYRYYPSVESWIKMISSLNKNFPGCRIYLTGVTKSYRGRSYTGGYTKPMLNKILSSFDNISYCYDIGIWNQLALMQSCEIFVSPHTGFAFLSQFVGTPWLAISGGDAPEYLFNQIPFYSVLPDEKEYPYFNKGKYSKHIRGKFFHMKGRIPPMMPKNLDRKIPELVHAAKLLTSKNFTYEKAILQHIKNIKNANIRRERMPQIMPESRIHALCNKIYDLISRV